MSITTYSGDRCLRNSAYLAILASPVHPAVRMHVHVYLPWDLQL